MLKVERKLKDENAFDVGHETDVHSRWAGLAHDLFCEGVPAPVSLVSQSRVD